MLIEANFLVRVWWVERSASRQTGPAEQQLHELVYYVLC